MPGRNRTGPTEGLGGLATFVDHVLADGRVVRRESRHHRKHLTELSGHGLTWWAPAARGWWIAVLFAVGSLLFAFGALPGYVGAVGTRWDSVTFFVGSLFFTSAAFLTYREAVDAGPRARDTARRRFFVYQPRRVDWWATGVQLVGTAYFTVSTAAAMQVDLTVAAVDQRVWRPDAVGSVCFLVASGLAWFEVCHGWLAWRPRSWAWWITLVNLVGSVAFGVSAVASYVIPATGQARNADRANLGTLVGAVFFLVGAVLLLPERTEDTGSTGSPADGGSGQPGR
ncbi:MAG TPA: hypothetical protein VGH99_00840 [Pseudonocardia sp.]|jgi:hypothetical protein